MMIPLITGTLLWMVCLLLPLSPVKIDLPVPSGKAEIYTLPGKTDMQYNPSGKMEIHTLLCKKDIAPDLPENKTDTESWTHKDVLFSSLYNPLHADTTLETTEWPMDPVSISPEWVTPRYRNLLSEDHTLDPSGLTVGELLERIGEPRFVIRQGDRDAPFHREIWILPIYLEDSTGLYLYFENGVVTKWRLDTFMGMGNHPQLLEWFNF